MARSERVHRPLRKSEYAIRFASTKAEKGWINLVAVRRNDMVDTWEYLTQTPLSESPRNSPLRGALGTVQHEGTAHARWQHKPSLRDGARIWFYVDGSDVFIEQVFTAHPNQTK